MNDNSVESPKGDVVSDPPASRTPRTAPRGGILAAAIIAAVLGLAACGSSSGGSSNARGSTNSQSLAFSRCMRAHGVPNFPDPDSGGSLPKQTLQQLGVSSSQFQGAQNACGYLLQPTQAQVRQVMSGMLDFAGCMRSHEVPNWPDPITDSRGVPVFDIPGIDPLSPQVTSAADACTHLLVQSTTGPTTIEVCNGIGEGGRCHGYGAPNS